MVATLDALTWADLVLPLARHDLRVRAGDRNACVEASLVVCFHDRAAERTIRACAAVVRTLRSRVATSRPAQRCPAIFLEEGVLLLDAEPWLLSHLLVEDGLGRISSVGRDRLHLRRQAVAQHENVVAAAERICEDCHWSQEHLGVVPGRLAMSNSRRNSTP